MYLLTFGLEKGGLSDGVARERNVVLRNRFSWYHNYFALALPPVCQVPLLLLFLLPGQLHPQL